MPNVQLGATTSDVSDAVYWTKRTNRMVDQYKASSLGTGRYSQLQILETELNSYITKVGRSRLSPTVEGSALLSAYNKLSRLEASERAISSAKIIDRQKTDEARAAAKASQQEAKDKYDADRAKDEEFTPRIDTGRDVLKPPDVNGGFNLSLPIMLMIGAAGIGAIFLFKG